MVIIMASHVLLSFTLRSHPFRSRKVIMSGEHGSETEWSEHENHNAKDLEKMKVA